MLKKNNGPGRSSGGGAPRASPGAASLKAAALRYDPSVDDAPRVIAKGQRKLAEQIVARGRDAGVPVVENEELVNALVSLPLDQEIPVELYAVVAEVLAWVLQMKTAVRPGITKSDLCRSERS
jgi:flagellar biosynthesis protein